MSTATLSAKQIVLPFLQALNDEDFDTARNFVSDNLTFRGVLGSRDGADAYFTDMKQMKFKYELIKVFAESNDVCILYNVKMSGEMKVFTCGWYTVENGRIAGIRVLFDPRPVLEQTKKQ